MIRLPSQSKVRWHYNTEERGVDSLSRPLTHYVGRGDLILRTTNHQEGWEKRHDHHGVMHKGCCQWIMSWRRKWESNMGHHNPMSKEYYFFFFCFFRSNKLCSFVDALFIKSIVHISIVRIINIVHLVGNIHNAVTVRVRTLFTSLVLFTPRLQL